MAKIKYYAVRVGRETGIFTDWERCKASVIGYEGATYKSFVDKDEAEDYFYGKSKKKPVVDKYTAVAYVDGSYNSDTRRYGSGVVLFFKGETIELSQFGISSELAKMRNVGGELMAVSMAIKEAVRLNAKRIIIHYDYAGIEQWANGGWQANKVGTREYKKFIERMRKLIAIEFSKVKAHSGNEYNDMADRLAKEAIGLK